MKNKIILEAETTIEDKMLREWFEKLSSKLDRINERTKKHTREIQDLRTKIKHLEEKHGK